MLFGSWQNLAKSPNFCIQLYGKTLERVAKFNYLDVVLDENLSWTGHVEYVSSNVRGGKGFCLVYDHASQWKPLNRYTLHSCSHYLTMLMLRGWKSQRSVAKSYNAY